MRHLKYLLYLLRHKWFVLLEMRKRGLFWQGLVHDSSKLRWSEWNNFANYFYGKKDKDLFELAEYLHKTRNPHHWEYWNDCPDEDLLKIPESYLVEMLCDWLAMEHAGKGSTHKWYENHKEKIRLHPKDKQWIENKLEKLEERKRR